jgi:DNA-binding IclR family transcriptional regulator
MQQAINRAFNILEMVSTDPDAPTSFNEIASGTGLNTGTCANIIKALVARGYLDKLDYKKGYVLGKKLYQLTGFDGYKKDILKVSKPILEELTQRLNENALLAVINGSSRIQLMQTKSNQDVQATSAAEKHVYDSASGRIMLALMTDAELERFVQKYGLPDKAQWKEAATPRGLKKEVESMRESGFAIQESNKQITGVGVGVEENGKCTAAISVFMPTFRYEKTNKALLIKEMMKASARISETMLR